jgi:hypothetical protein
MKLRYVMFEKDVPLGTNHKRLKGFSAERGIGEHQGWDITWSEGRIWLSKPGHEEFFTETRIASAIPMAKEKRG